MPRELDRCADCPRIRFLPEERCEAQAPGSGTAQAGNGAHPIDDPHSGSFEDNPVPGTGRG
jgi:hypothetical protein